MIVMANGKCKTVSAFLAISVIYCEVDETVCRSGVPVISNGGTWPFLLKNYFTLLS